MHIYLHIPISIYLSIYLNHNRSAAYRLLKSHRNKMGEIYMQMQSSIDFYLQ